MTGRERPFANDRLGADWDLHREISVTIMKNEYRVDLRNVRDMNALVGAFNDGLIRAVGGHWHGNNWDAFNDYLSWPEDESYILLLDGWSAFVNVVVASPQAACFNASGRIRSGFNQT